MKTAHIAELREIVTAAVGPDSAPKLTEAIVRATEFLEEETAGHVATKEDILLLKADIAEFKADMAADLAAVKTDIAGLKERAATKEDFQRLAKALSGQFMAWFFGLVGLVLTAAGLVLGGVYYMLTNIKH